MVDEESVIFWLENFVEKAKVRVTGVKTTVVEAEIPVALPLPSSPILCCRQTPPARTG
ncbi:MAG: hypothetical protein VX884_00110 [Pseudomonadota bacterium]|nr:hypothetical protein [Pseudomonadota bacterium]